MTLPPKKSAWRDLTCSWASVTTRLVRDDQSSLVKAIEAAGEAGEKLSITYFRKGKRQRQRFTPQKVESVTDDDDDDGDEDADDDEDEEGDDDEDADDDADDELGAIHRKIEAERAKAMKKAAAARQKAERARAEAGKSHETGAEAISRPARFGIRGRIKKRSPRIT